MAGSEAGCLGGCLGGSASGGWLLRCTCAALRNADAGIRLPARPPAHRWGPRLAGVNSGVMLVRPCTALLDHMLSVLDTHPKLRFTHGGAEQDFLNW